MNSYMAPEIKDGKEYNYKVINLIILLNIFIIYIIKID